MVQKKTELLLLRQFCRIHFQKIGEIWEEIEKKKKMSPVKDEKSRSSNAN
jgi:hypothetical protein